MKQLASSLVAHLSSDQIAEYREVRQKDAAAKVKWTLGAWSIFNATLFGGRLRKPNIRLLRDMGKSMRKRAHWESSGTIRMSPALFDAPLDLFCGVLVHEICHQAVTQIDGAYETINGGHGPLWKSWARRCGISDSQYDENPNSAYVERRDAKGRRR